MKAQCQCGQLEIELPGPSDAIVACHCTACQRRTGAPFGVLAYYPSAQILIRGASTRFTRTADSGDPFDSFFCPACGSTLYARTAKHPDKTGVAIGAIADPDYPAPVRSVWEDMRHNWVMIPGNIPHFPKGRS